MKQYISKDALVAEIEERRDSLISLSESCPANTAAKSGFYAQAQTLEGIKNFINTLEVKEVDLEKEIKEQIDKYYENCNKKLEEMGEDDNDISFLTLDGFARHFYELGLKVQKGE